VKSEVFLLRNIKTIEDAPNQCLAFKFKRIVLISSQISQNGQTALRNETANPPISDVRGHLAMRVSEQGIP
jgi:hypothetical protein